MRPARAAVKVPAAREIEGERVVQAAFGALLFVGHGPYLVRHELEANGGYTDIAFHPQLDRWPQIGHAALIELKYLKAKDDASPEALAKLKAAAAEQLDRYAADRDLARLWHLDQVEGCRLKVEQRISSNSTSVVRPPTSNLQPSVRLTRLAIVFHGAELALCEEI